VGYGVFQNRLDNEPACLNLLVESFRWEPLFQIEFCRRLVGTSISGEDAQGAKDWWSYWQMSVKGEKAMPFAGMPNDLAALAPGFDSAMVKQWISRHSGLVSLLTQKDLKLLKEHMTIPLAKKIQKAVWLREDDFPLEVISLANGVERRDR
jgi:hypothetical protein